MSLLLITAYLGAGLVPRLPFVTCSFPLASSSIPVSGFFLFFSLFSFLGQCFCTQSCSAEQQHLLCLHWGRITLKGQPGAMAELSEGLTCQVVRGDALLALSNKLGVSLQMHNQLCLPALYPRARGLPPSLRLVGRDGHPSHALQLQWDTSVCWAAWHGTLGTVLRCSPTRTQPAQRWLFVPELYPGQRQEKSKVKPSLKEVCSYQFIF